MGWIPEWVAGSVLSGCPRAHLISLGGKSRNLGIFILYRFLWRKENVFIIKINKAWWKQLPKTHHLHWWRQLFFSGEIAMLSFGFGNYYYYFLFRIYRVYRKILTELFSFDWSKMATDTRIPTGNNIPYDYVCVFRSFLPVHLKY